MKDTKSPKFIDAKRRGFMQGASVAGVAAATGVVSSTASATDVAPLPETGKDNVRYKESDYVRAYYRNARF